jgi:TonB family protein
MYRSQKLTLGFILLIPMMSSVTAQDPPPLPPYRIGGLVTQPQLIHKVEPEYSEEARNAKWQGTVQLEIVVDETGVPKDVRVKRALGLGLDQKAIEAVKLWRFKPGQKEGVPVPVIAVIDVSFRLLDDPPQPKPVPSAPPAAIDPEKRAVIEELLSMVNGEDMAQQMLKQLGPLVEQQFGRVLDQLLPKTIDRSAISADVQAFQKDLVSRISARVVSELRSISMNVYGEAFTTQELRELVAFYRTPTGQVLARKLPELSQKASAAGQQVVLQMLPELQKATQDWVEMMKKKYAQ